MIRRFCAAWRFLTIFPAPLSCDADEAEHLRRSLPLFPAIGVLLGVLAWVMTLGSVRVLPVTAAAAVAVGVLAAFSGGLHLDGLSDSCDGLLSHRSRERALEIMRDSRIGTMGAIGLVMTLLIKFACLASLSKTFLPLAVLLVPLGGRAGMSIVMAALPYARESGLGNMIAVDSLPRRILVGCAWLLTALGVVWGIRGMAIGFLLWAAVIGAWIAFLQRKLGGATGDTFGAASELGETAVCLAAAIVMQARYF